MLALCVLNDYVSFYRLYLSFTYLSLKSLQSCSDSEPRPLRQVHVEHKLIAPPPRLAKLGIGCPYMSIFIHSEIEIILKYFSWIPV